MLSQANLQSGANGSVNITVKNVPEPVYLVVKREAKKHGEV
jgi:hypothetical protein